MKIKAIEIHGFKSFFKKANLEFLPGITAMVGPNGCGKSNIVDAIRWALGEQSAKHLRGNVMEDVIFNGSKDKKPLSMAEVSLTFANDNGSLPIQYREFSEIQVTRRVFRSGESEYFINKAACRLKDITELFLDTGVGTKAYSILEQGQVDKIINSKPQELRLLLEEAAGISKYKARKQEALRKMDATRQNLVRVNDVLGELSKQISSLRYQAQKLRRFKGLKDRIRTLELALASQKHLALETSRSRKSDELSQLKDRQAALLAERNTLEAELVTRKATLHELEEAFNATEKKALEIQFAVKAEEANVDRKKEKISDLERQIQKASQDEEDYLGRLRGVEEEISRAQALREELTGNFRAMEAQVRQEEERLAALKGDFASLRNDLEAQRTELFESRHEMTRREHNVSRTEQARGESERRLTQSRHETDSAQVQLEEVRAQRALAQRELEESREALTELEHEQESLLGAITQGEQSLKELIETIAGLKEKQARAESQLESLRELQASFEGCSDGVRSIMQRRHEITRSGNGIYGLVADFVETTPQLEVAVEAVLGERLQYVIVQSHAEGIEAIDYLKTQSLGRGSFLPLKTEKPLSLQAAGTNGSTWPQATPLVNLISVKDGYQPVINYLLGDTLVVEDLCQALAFWKSADAPHTFVTLGGEIVDSKGVITGGYQNGTGSRFLKKKREMRELEELLASLSRELEGTQQERELQARDLTEKRAALKQIQDRVVKQKLFLQSKERDVRQYSEEGQRIQHKIEFLALEEKKLVGELDELDEELALYRAEIEALGARHAALEEAFSELQGREKRCREEIEAQEEVYNHCRADLMDLKARVSSLASALELREQSRANCTAQIAKSRAVREEAEKDIASLREAIETALEQVSSLSLSYHLYQEHIREQGSRLHEKREELQTLEAKAKDLQNELNDLHPSLLSLDHDLGQITSELGHLEETIGTKYHLSLKAVIGEYPAENYPPEETQAKLSKLEDVQGRMLEQINFNAEREYEEKTQNHEFYRTQADDLNKSLEALQEAIQKINRTSRERFRATFDQVQTNFKEILPLVFEGGRGELSLTDESDLLETGVEIMVQPAGKTLRHISLLSGGEKALSAISLLFSLYLIKPTPFCLLDEVDAPLDDSNIDRFLKILQQFAPTSQFILITHNKKTMEIAHTLYGITMEEPGISKIVSVRLN